MISRAERDGLALSIGAHLLLFGVLTLGMMLRVVNPPLPKEAMDVELLGPIGRQSSVPNPATEAPAESQAPELGKPTDAPPPPDSEAVAEPDPAPAPVPKPAAKPEPKPKDKAAEKPAPAKPASSKPREKLSSDLLKDVRAKAANERKATGSRLGPDFLKGIASQKTDGKGQAPRAAISGIQMAGLAAAIAAQVRPCYNVPQGGTDASTIITILRLRFNRDGSVAGSPSVVDHQGVTPSNQGYVRQMDDAAKRAVLRCAPLKLPADLYEGGWEDIEFVFNPRAME